MPIPSASRYTRRDVLAGLCAAPFLIAPARRPNVLVFMTDQESALLPGVVRRPNYNLLAKRGVRFTSAFCNTPQCSPARSSLLTGLEPHHTGVLTNVDASSLGKPLATSVPTIGSVFQADGYRTGYFGKWHLGDERVSLQAFGFAEHQGGRDEKVAERAAAWIKEQTGPWLAWVSVLNPHDIYQLVDEKKPFTIRPSVQAPATDRADLAGKPAAQQEFLDKDQGKPTLPYTAEDWRRYRSYYCDLVEKADACLGIVLAAVDDWSNTIVVYTSDHGDQLGEHGLPFKGPFLYEPEIRIPLVIAAPSLAAGTERSDFAMSMDVAPTVAGLAGLRFPGKIDGRDLRDGKKSRDAVFLEYYGKQHWVEPIRAIRTERWKLSVYKRGESELYDLRNDPNEAKNLTQVAEFQKVKAGLRDRLDSWWTGAVQ